jgi:hypothetical protein
MKSNIKIAKVDLLKIFKPGSFVKNEGNGETVSTELTVKFSKEPFDNLLMGTTDYIDLVDPFKTSVEYKLWCVELGVLTIDSTGLSENILEGSVRVIKERLPLFGKKSIKKSHPIPTYFIVYTSVLAGDYFEMNHKDWKDECVIFELTEDQKKSISERIFA